MGQALLAVLARAKTAASEQPLDPYGPSGLSMLVLAAGCLAACTYWIALVRDGRPLAPYEPRDQVPWTIWHVLAILFMAIWLDAIAVALFAEISIDAEGHISPDVLQVVCAARLLALLIGVAVLSTFGRATWSDLGLRAGKTASDVGVGLVVFFAVAGPLILIQVFLLEYFQQPQPLVKQLLDKPDIRMMWIATVAVVVVAPLVEEFFFRVVLQGWLERFERSKWRLRGPRRWPRGVVPVVISSALFALAHANQGTAPIPLFLLGLFLGYLYHRTHRILPSLTVHAALNGFTIMQLWFSTIRPPT